MFYIFEALIEFLWAYNIGSAAVVFDVGIQTVDRVRSNGVNIDYLIKIVFLKTETVASVIDGVEVNNDLSDNTVLVIA